MNRLLEAEKIKQIRVRNSERTGRKLKVEELPDLVPLWNMNSEVTTESVEVVD